MELARRRIPKPSWYLPRSLFWWTISRVTREPISRDTVDLWIPISSAISLTPACPSRARISRTVRARSTDCTPPDCPPSASVSDSVSLFEAILPDPMPVSVTAVTLRQAGRAAEARGDPLAAAVGGVRERAQEQGH